MKSANINSNRVVLTRAVVATIGAVCLVVPALAERATSQGLASTDVFVSGAEGYHTFRIPALVVTNSGTLLALCEGRKDNRSDHGDIDLILKRSTDDGRTWSRPSIVYEEGGSQKVTIGNACPVVDQDTGTIWLPFCRDNDDVLITYSTDDGQTWAKPREITQDVKKPVWGWYATGPGVGIQLASGSHKGRLVIPCDHREPYKGKPAMFSHVFYSDDHGTSWKLGGTVAPHTDECQVVELADGRLMMNMRNYWGRSGGRADRDRMRATSLSSDGGITWSELKFDKTLIEPICQASFLRYTHSAAGDKSRLLFSNPASKTDRQRMTVRLSYDEGASWPVAKLLYAGSAAYSCLTILPDGQIGMLYERDSYGKITFVRYGLEWLTTR